MMIRRRGVTKAEYNQHTVSPTAFKNICITAASNLSFNASALV